MTVDRSRRPSPGPAPKIRLSGFRRFRLQNGLTVIAIPHDDVPEVSARIVFPCGSTEDESGRAGTALLVARALTEGTTAHSAREIAEWLDYLGARFRVDVTHDSTVLDLRFLSRVFDDACDLLAEIVAKPAFEAEEVDRLRDERLDEIASGLDEPRIIANLRLSEACFGSHPYGMREGGVEETVREIDAETLSRFHSRHYRPSSATLIVVGDLPESAGLEARLETAFRGWAGEAAGVTALPEPRPAESRRLWAVDWSGPQSEIRIGGLGIARLDPAYPAAMVMNAILGGLFSSRINMNLRERRGWTYGAYTRVDARRQRGPFYCATAVGTEATVDAAREILGEMERMKTDPPTEKELELAKNSLTFSLPRLFETVGQVSARVAHQVVYGLPDDYWEAYPDLVAAVTETDVLRAAEKYLATDRAAIIVVGPIGPLRSALERLGPLELRDIRGRPAHS